MQTILIKTNALTIAASKKDDSEYWEGEVKMRGVKVGKVYRDRLMSNMEISDDVDGVGQPSDFVWRAEIGKRPSAAFYSIYGLLDWVECLFTVSIGSEF